MRESKLARIIRVVLLFWLVASIALVVAMVSTLRPWQDQKHGRKETESSGLVGGTIEKCVAAKAFSHPIGVVAAAVPSFGICVQFHAC